jgi:pentatricopeptide repeat protein
VDIAPAARSTLLAHCLALLAAVPGLQLDTTHYNAVLKVHLENGESSVAASFLAEMEAAGCAPNRATFQHLVGLYCYAGNLPAATAVLEHMKEEGMAINEAVFLSLLTGHCLALDSASVASTLEVMAGNGLIIDPLVHAVVAAGYGRAGDWDKVEETLVQAEAAGVVLDDGDLLSVMIGCCQGGLHRQATDHVQPRLPHKAGFFQVTCPHP